MEEIGKQCHYQECNRLSFLPIDCTYCRATFCEQHHLPDQHACDAPSRPSTSSNGASAALKATAPKTARKPCDAKNCKAFSLEILTSSSSAGFSHAAPKCERCQGSFCATHRSTVSHNCKGSAPLTEGQKKILAAEERKRKAQEVLKKNFPSRSSGTR